MYTHHREEGRSDQTNACGVHTYVTSQLGVVIIRSSKLYILYSLWRYSSSLWPGPDYDVLIQTHHSSTWVTWITIDIIGSFLFLFLNRYTRSFNSTPHLSEILLESFSTCVKVKGQDRPSQIHGLTSVRQYVVCCRVFSPTATFIDCLSSLELLWPDGPDWPYEHGFVAVVFVDFWNVVMCEEVSSMQK